MSQHISALTWFRFDSGDLQLFEWLRFRLHLSRCHTCRAQRDARSALGVGGEVWQHQLRRGAVALAMVVLVGLVVAPLMVARSPLERRGDLTAKGGGSTFSLVKVEPKAAQLEAVCAPGDVLQAEVRTSKKYVLVLGASQSETQLLYPVGMKESAEVLGGVVRMPNSWVLDQTSGVERFIALFTDAPLDAEATMGKVSRGEPIPNAEQVTRECRKP